MTTDFEIKSQKGNLKEIHSSPFHRKHKIHTTLTLPLRTSSGVKYLNGCPV